MANIRRLETPAGVRYQVDYYDPDGRRVKRRFERRGDADDYLAEVVVSIKRGRYGEVFGRRDEPPPPPSFRDVLGPYRELYRGQRSYKSFKEGILGVLEGRFGDRPLPEITYRDLEFFRQERLEAPTWKGTPRTPARVNREMAVLRHVLNKAVEWGMLDSSPFHGGRGLGLKEGGVRQRFLTDEEAARLLGACPGHLRPIVEMALNTGLRSGELLKLEWDQVRDGFIYVAATAAKSGEGRAVPLNARAREVLADLRRRHQLSSPHVFGRRYGSVKTAFRGALRRAGIRGFRFHDLRHTFASNLVRRGVPLRVVQEILGHSDIKMTIRYSHLAPGDLRAAVGVLDNPVHHQSFPSLENGETWHLEPFPLEVGE